jgi:hypothetical protein
MAKLFFRYAAIVMGSFLDKVFVVSCTDRWSKAQSVPPA